MYNVMVYFRTTVTEVEPGTPVGVVLRGHGDMDETLNETVNQAIGLLSTYVPHQEMEDGRRKADLQISVFPSDHALMSQEVDD